MKTLFVLSALCACAFADSLYAYNTIPYSSVYPYSATYSPYVNAYYPVQQVATHQKSAVIPNVLPSNLNKQYHAQDSLGQFSFGYTNPQSGRSEVKSADGTVAGQYSYVQPQGNVVQVKYVADSQGYRVQDAVPQTIGFRAKRDTPADTVKVGDYRDGRQLYYPVAGSYLYPGALPVVQGSHVGQQYVKTVVQQPAGLYNPYYGHAGVYPHTVPVVYTTAAKDSFVKGSSAGIAGAEFPKTVVQA
jgi:hypothetical protein